MNARRPPLRRLGIAALLLFALTAASSAWAGNPFLVNSVSGPVTWENGQVPFNTDLGPLGILDNATATKIARDAFAIWQAVPTASITTHDLGPILINGVPTDVTFANFRSVLFFLDGQSPVIFDHTGNIMDALGLGDFAGVSIGEYLTPFGAHYRERAIILNGLAVDANGPFNAVGYPALVTHEVGHHLGLGHSIVNGQAIAFREPLLGLPPPPFTSVETMCPFIFGNSNVQASPHRDDIGILSFLYPADGFLAGTGIIQGTILSADLVSPLPGANVTARNLANPHHDAVSSISGSVNYFFDSGLPPSGQYAAIGLTPGASYQVGITSLRAGVFSSPYQTLLPGPYELYNGDNESNDPPRDLPADFVAVVPQAGTPVEGIDIIINSGTAQVRILKDANALTQIDDAAASGFAVPKEIDIRRVESRFVDTDRDSRHDTLTVDIDVVGPLGARDSDFRFLIDFGEIQKVGQNQLSLRDQTQEPGTKGIPTSDVMLKMTLDGQTARFSGLPSLGLRSHVDLAAGRIHFEASVAEILGAATPEQISAARFIDGTFTVVGFASAALRKYVDRAPDTNDNEVPTIVQETLRFTFLP